MIELVKMLADNRSELEAAKQYEATLKAQVEETAEWKAYQSASEWTTYIMSGEAAVKSALSEAMLAHAEETGETKFDFGQVVNSRSVNITDTDAALAWAIERQICLSLDASALKKVAEELKPAGVEIVESKATRISADLSEYLEAE